MPGPSGQDRTPDATLIERARAGDRPAFSEIYERYRPNIARYVQRRVTDRSLAEEIVQETFVRAWVSIRKVDPGRELRPWLSTIAKNLIVDEHRKRLRSPERDQPDPHIERATEDTTLEAVLMTESALALRRAVLDLPPRQRRILLASVLEHMSAAELAALEHISESSVSSVVYRARRAVRRNLRRLAGAAGLLRVLRRGRGNIHRMLVSAQHIAVGCACVAATVVAGGTAPPIHQGPTSGAARSAVRSSVDPSASRDMKSIADAETTVVIERAPLPGGVTLKIAPPAVPSPDDLVTAVHEQQRTISREKTSIPLPEPSPGTP